MNNARNKLRGLQGVSQLINALKDRDEFVRQRAAAALGQIGDARAVDNLIIATKDKNPNVRQKSKEALEKLRHHLTAVTKEKAACFLCPQCLCRFQKYQAKLGALTDFPYYACRYCHSSQFIDNVARVIVVLDVDFDVPYAHSNSTLMVNWFEHKEPFDFDEVQIKAADDIIVEEFVMKLRNDVDKLRRKRYSSIRLYLSSDVILTQSKINLLKSTFSIGANDNAK
jgi:hypothetical protein